MARSPQPYMKIREGRDGRRTITVSTKHLEQMIREEFAKAILEADGEEDESDSEKKEKGGPSKVDASADKPKKQSPDKSAGFRQGTDPLQMDADAEAEDEEEVPDEEDPADDKIRKDAYGENDPSGKLANELVGKTVQSITREPKSKLVPGAQELVISFNEITDPLRVIITKTGEVRFFFRNALHNMI